MPLPYNHTLYYNIAWFMRVNSPIRCVFVEIPRGWYMHNELQTPPSAQKGFSKKSVSTWSNHILWIVLTALKQCRLHWTLLHVACGEHIRSSCMFGMQLADFTHAKKCNPHIAFPTHTPHTHSHPRIDAHGTLRELCVTKMHPIVQAICWMHSAAPIYSWFIFRVFCRCRRIVCSVQTFGNMLTGN